MELHPEAMYPPYPLKEEDTGREERLEAVHHLRVGMGEEEEAMALHHPECEDRRRLVDLDSLAHLQVMQMMHTTVLPQRHYRVQDPHVRIVWIAHHPMTPS